MNLLVTALVGRYGFDAEGNVRRRTRLIDHGVLTGVPEPLARYR
jgi:predicted Zn-dependent protease